MTPAGHLFLGILQGLTEFLPVSSSGHLALVLHFTGWDERSVLPTVILLHLATTLAVAVYFRRDLARLGRGILLPSSPEAPAARRLLLLLVAGSIPTAVIGLVFKDPLERLFTSPRAVVAGLALTGLVLAAAELAARRYARPRSITPSAAAAIGTAQGIAIAPGVSRSGVTIGAALLLGAGRDEAFSFSFLLSIPANLGAVILEARGLGAAAFGGILWVTTGMAAAFLTGYAALALLARWVRGGRLIYFTLYCWLLAALAAASL